MKFAPIVNEEKTSSGGMTHRLDFSYQDIPAGVALAAVNTFNALPLPKLQLNDVISKSLLVFTELFQNTADNAFNTTTISVGLVTGGVAALVAAAESNANGTSVAVTTPGVATPAVPIKNATAGNQVTLTINSQTGKSISNLNRGKGYVLFSIDRPLDQARVKSSPFGPGTTTTN